MRSCGYSIEVISIHAPRAGSDRPTFRRASINCVFQSTLPVRGATIGQVATPAAAHIISIHAPRAGSDPFNTYLLPLIVYFNPRSPCGERQTSHAPLEEDREISIHAPRAGSDRRAMRR